MKRSKIRAISLLMAAIMAFSMLGVAPLMAFADEAEEAAVEAVEAAGEEEEAAGEDDVEALEGEEEELVDPLAGDVASVNGTPYATLALALSNAYDGDTVTLLADVSESTYILMSPGVSGTLDMAGFSMDLGTAGIDVAGTLTIVNGGTITVGTTVWVEGGNLTVTANIVSGAYGIEAVQGATVTVYGDISAEYDGVYAEGGSTVQINGNITSASGDGIFAYDGSEVIVNGNVTSGGGTPFCAAFAGGAGTVVTVNGNLISTNPDGAGAWVGGGGQVIVNGTISAANYIVIQDANNAFLFEISDHEAVSSKAGYLEYTDGVSFVWVLIPTSGGGTGGDGLAATGDTAFYGLALLFSLLALGALGLAMSRKLRVKESL
ncbi:MAG: hypothetical protein FWE41_09440 [Coriobacteriia bacterium]|nr:hypothetical protein [Coriobacteriia bacterium]MCL2749606.1 hypothetical protein [Coriobacteriia bacterium]